MRFDASHLLLLFCIHVFQYMDTSLGVWKPPSNWGDGKGVNCLTGDFILSHQLKGRSGVGIMII